VSKYLSWNALFLNGSIVSLSVGAWRARVALRASDLGVEDSPEVQKALTHGNTRLMPRKAFESITSASREAAGLVDRYSVNFGLIRGARYVPEGNLPKLLGMLAKVKNDHAAAVDAFMDQFEAQRDAILPVIEKALQDAAKTPEAARAAFERIQAEYPAASEVRGQFSLSWSVYALSSPKSAATAEAAKQEAEGVKSILGDMVKQLRADITDKVQSIMEICAKGGKLPERSIDVALELLDRVDSLNILGDRELEAQTRALRKMLVKVDPKAVDSGFVTGLTQVQEALKGSVEDAIRQAEDSLTGLGRRQIAIDDEEAAPVAAVTNSGTEVPMDL
jgi:hypothetical protein